MGMDAGKVLVSRDNQLFSERLLEVSQISWATREAEVLGVDSFSEFNALHSRQHD
jgi:hypothetical protein